MSFKKYLKENISLFCFCGILIMFISGYESLDKNNKVFSNESLYVAAVGIFMFFVYVAFDFIKKSSYVKKLEALKNSKDKTPILPRPMEYKDELYISMIEDIYENSMEDIRKVQNDFKENDEFMTAWVHEIKTPITTLKLVLESEGDNIPKETVTSINEEIDKIEEYVEKVLYNSRGDNFSKDYVISEVKAGSVIKESIKKHSAIFIKKHIILKDEVPNEFVVDTDKKWLLFILDQLLSNALKYTGEQGVISFSSMENDEEKVIIVEDNGIGIKEEDLKRIFNKAFTGSNGRIENSNSTGFGLYLSQKLSKKLGHYITIESKYGAGTKALIHFPKWNDYFEVTKM